MTAKTGDVAVTQRRSGARGVIDVVYGYLAAFFVLGVLVQVFLAGVGVFGINASKVANASSFDPHRAWGTVLMAIALVLLILALIAWASRGTVIGTWCWPCWSSSPSPGWRRRVTATSGRAGCTRWTGW